MPGRSGRNGSRYSHLPSSDSEPQLLPWNPRIELMKFVRPVKTRASLIAPSTASVPLLMKKEYCRSPGVISPSSSASAPRSGSSSSCDESGMRWSWSATAFRILGCRMPAL